MTLKEEIRAILKAAPHLPVQTTSGIVFLIVIPVFLFRGFQELSYNWTISHATPIEIGKVQERIKDDKPEFYFKVVYEYGPGLSYNHEESNQSEFLVKDKHEILLRDSSQVEIWFASNSPEIARMQNPSAHWYLYFIFSGVFFSALLYFRWLLIKYYQLELAD